MRNYEISADKLHELIEKQWKVELNKNEYISGISVKQSSSIGDLYFVTIDTI